MIETSLINSLVIPYFYTPHSSWIVGWRFREGILSIWTAKQNMLCYRFVGSRVRDAINLVTRLLKDQSPGKAYNDYVKNNPKNWLRVTSAGKPYYVGSDDSFTHTDQPVIHGPKLYSPEVNDDNVRMIASLRFDMSELRNRVALLEQDKRQRALDYS